MDQIIELFPTPFMRVEKLLDTESIEAIKHQFLKSVKNTNAKSLQLSHSEMLSPEENPLFKDISELIIPKLCEFGLLMFGERLSWSIKEMWGNVLQTNGYQAMHNHANCFISGVIYLTPSHPSANTIFMKGPGGRDFAFSHASSQTELGPFNADKWVSPDVTPGDMVLFPSYLLHEVRPNLGPLRISLAFNAIPTRLDSWGYAIGFSR